ncbi:RhuM family protein [Allisonella histaminiformans]|uniref:RhuM family protein n=1 Tax=Allisonella histaminiformans TaxID=209880 RepID=UPI002942EACD|nr:RhuM family protein [Allisonella histaminiformans]
MDNIIIYNTDDGKTNVRLYATDGTVWMTQTQIAELFDSSKQNIGQHLKHCFDERELDKNSVVKYFFTTASDGKKYNTAFYSLDAILAVGFRVRSPRGVQFRRWANTTLKEYMQKGFVIDDERLKNPDGRPDYFDELLARIRDIRASEKRFYQKLRDLFALSSDYDKTDKATQQFFAETQNKLIYGITGETAADLIIDRANPQKPNMALTSWSGAIVRRRDIIVAKNYLATDEIDSLNRLVTIFLESAELRVKMRKDLTLDYWRNTVDKLLSDHDIPILSNHGHHSRREMLDTVNTAYDVFDARRKQEEAQQADEDDLKELEAEIPAIKSRSQHEL